MLRLPGLWFFITKEGTARIQPGRPLFSYRDHRRMAFSQADLEANNRRHTDAAGGLTDGRTWLGPPNAKGDRRHLQATGLFCSLTQYLGDPPNRIRASPFRASYVWTVSELPAGVPVSRCRP